MVPNRSIISPSPQTNVTPLEKHYHEQQFLVQVGYWRVYSAKTVFGEKDASVMVFERKNNVKAPPRIGRMNKFALVDLIKYEVGQLSSLVHPRILHVQHMLEDTKEFLAFATEPVYTSLDNLVIEEVVERLEIKLGVLQIIDGLSYLHNSAKILHGNLTPSSIYVTNTRMWKIAGFAFAVAAKEPDCYPCYPWTKKLPPILQPDLDFLAPEYLEPNQQSVSSSADVFSLGVLICWIYGALRQLDDISQVFDPSQKSHFLGHALVSALPVIPEVSVADFTLFFLKFPYANEVPQA
ncbi:hypothetical protein DICVIV_09992 [Dictyocaulus viviparus]|uniref:Protein kinase domain-containing protein n=1 Tax=Dictyocaulus viviparus TaxID=29172 RepID=A0A0D8XH49_DICVI|nr:hypothetical protein DICVIV_09992 [Dictyocaulus viviparus]